MDGRKELRQLAGLYRLSAETERFIATLETPVDVRRLLNIAERTEEIAADLEELLKASKVRRRDSRPN